jgi:hypothetical protein
MLAAGFQGWHRDFYLEMNVIATIVVNIDECDMTDYIKG